MVDVSETVNNGKLNRRSLLLGAVFLVGGAAALTRYTRGPASAGDPAAALSPDQFSLLEQVAEAMIPATDTPGAIGAGVPQFLRELLATWASAEVRAKFAVVLAEID